jgi:hypothetical protein
MFKACGILLSRPQRQHFRKKIPGFYSPYLGASFMKHWPVIPYRRLSPSLFHYPKVSQVTGKPIDWRYGVPTSGYEPLKIYGANTLEIKGLPMGKTPEYIQERLRRYFSKFGAVTLCRALNHPLDPYQCEGTAYISFRDVSSCEKAVKSTLRFGNRDMGYKALSLRVLLTDESNDGKACIAKSKSEIEAISAVTEKIFSDVKKSSAMLRLDDISLSENERELLLNRFGTLREYFDRLKSLFIISEEGELVARRLVDSVRELEEFRLGLERELNESLSVHWRINAPIKDLPEYTKRQIRLWDKKDPLPFDIQILSRDMRQHRVFDEKFLVESKKKRDRSWNRAESRRAAIAKRRDKKNSVVTD